MNRNYILCLFGYIQSSTSDEIVSLMRTKKKIRSLFFFNLLLCRVRLFFFITISIRDLFRLA